MWPVETNICVLKWNHFWLWRWHVGGNLNPSFTLRRQSKLGSCILDCLPWPGWSRLGEWSWKPSRVPRISTWMGDYHGSPGLLCRGKQWQSLSVCLLAWKPYWVAISQLQFYSMFHHHTWLLEEKLLGAKLTELPASPLLEPSHFQGIQDSPNHIAKTHQIPCPVTGNTVLSIHF